MIAVPQPQTTYVLIDKGGKQLGETVCVSASDRGTCVNVHHLASNPTGPRRYQERNCFTYFISRDPTSKRSPLGVIRQALTKAGHTTVALRSVPDQRSPR